MLNSILGRCQNRMVGHASIMEGDPPADECKQYSVKLSKVDQRVF